MDFVRDILPWLGLAVAAAAWLICRRIKKRRDLQEGKAEDLGLLGMLGGMMLGFLLGIALDDRPLWMSVGLLLGHSVGMLFRKRG